MYYSSRELYMKTFKEYIHEINDNVDPMDVKRAYYKLLKQSREGKLNDFDQRKLNTLANHPDVKKSLKDNQGN